MAVLFFFCVGLQVRGHADQAVTKPKSRIQLAASLRPICLESAQNSNQWLLDERIALLSTVEIRDA